MIESENTIVSFSPEEDLIHFLLLNASEMPDLGVYNGRMKAILFFFSMSGRKPNKIYEDFSFELLEELYELLDQEVPLNFQSGLSGIGWTVEYLIKNKYLATDEDTCGKFDKRLFYYLQCDLYKGIDIRQGLNGQLLYWISRMNNEWAVKKKETVTCFHLSIKKILSELRNHIDLLLLTMKEVENKDFTVYQLLIYSKWEFPVVLWSIGECVRLDVCSSLAVDILKDVVYSLHIENMPEENVNKRLLLFSFNSLLKLNMPSLNNRLIILINNLDREINPNHTSESQCQSGVFIMDTAIKDFNSSPM